MNQVSEISEVDEGDKIKIYYESKQSNNELEISMEVLYVKQTDNIDDLKLMVVGDDMENERHITIHLYEDVGKVWRSNIEEKEYGVDSKKDRVSGNTLERHPQFLGVITGFEYN